MYLFVKPEESVELRVKFTAGTVKKIGNIITISINTLKIKSTVPVPTAIARLGIKVLEDTVILLAIIKDLSIIKLQICGEWLRWMRICASTDSSLRSTSVTDTLDFWKKI